MAYMESQCTAHACGYISGDKLFCIGYVQVDPVTGEIAGVFESIQPSDTDLGAKSAKDIKITGTSRNQNLACFWFSRQVQEVWALSLTCGSTEKWELGLLPK